MDEQHNKASFGTRWGINRKLKRGKEQLKQQNLAMNREIWKISDKAQKRIWRIGSHRTEG